MSSSAIEIVVPTARNVSITDEALTVDLRDGRSISVPLTWYPRLVHASDKERKTWRLVADGLGIHWPDLDEDISVQGLLAGLPSGETHQSFAKWLKSRGSRPKHATKPAKKRGS